MCAGTEPLAVSAGYLLDSPYDQVEHRAVRFLRRIEPAYRGDRLGDAFARNHLGKLNRLRLVPVHIAEPVCCCPRDEVRGDAMVQAEQRWAYEAVVPAEFALRLAHDTRDLVFEERARELVEHLLRGCIVGHGRKLMTA